MNFNTSIKREIKTINLNDYAERVCPYCNSIFTFKRDSRYRTISDLGTPDTKVTIKLQVGVIGCLECGKTHKPEHPDFPRYYRFSKNVIKTALWGYMKNNWSGQGISSFLSEHHKVTVHYRTVNEWIKKLKDDYVNYEKSRDKSKIPSWYKTITIDGTFLNFGADLIGKKK